MYIKDTQQHQKLLLCLFFQKVLSFGFLRSSTRLLPLHLPMLYLLSNFWLEGKLKRKSGQFFLVFLHTSETYVAFSKGTLLSTKKKTNKKKLPL